VFTPALTISPLRHLSRERESTIYKHVQEESRRVHASTFLAAVLNLKWPQS
jgi:hypothetical protein